MPVITWLFFLFKKQLLLLVKGVVAWTQTVKYKETDRSVFARMASQETPTIEPKDVQVNTEFLGKESEVFQEYWRVLSMCWSFTTKIQDVKAVENLIFHPIRGWIKMNWTYMIVELNYYSKLDNQFKLLIVDQKQQD